MMKVVSEIDTGADTVGSTHRCIMADGRPILWIYSISYMYHGKVVPMLN